MKEIQLTKGFVAQVDDEDYDWLNSYKWHISRSNKLVYAIRASKRSVDGKQRHILMHREILGITGKSQQADHIDRNGLNNQRSNLRACTAIQNASNTTKPPNKEHGFRGIVKHRNKYRAELSFNYKKKRSESYSTPVEAALAYNELALKYHGEFAVLNIIKNE